MEIIYISILFTVFLVGEIKNLRISTFALMCHGFLLAIAVFSLALKTGFSSLYLISFIDLVVRALFLPGLLLKSLKIRDSYEEKPSINHPLSMALSIILLSLCYHFITIFKIQYIPQVLDSFSSGLTLLMYGFYLMLSKTDAFKMVTGFFIIENGVHLLIISLIPHLPKLIEISLSFNLIVAISFFVYLMLKINEIFIREKIMSSKKSRFEE